MVGVVDVVDRSQSTSVADELLRRIAALRYPLAHDLTVATLTTFSAQRLHLLHFLLKRYFDDEQLTSLHTIADDADQTTLVALLTDVVSLSGVCTECTGAQFVTAKDVATDKALTTLNVLIDCVSDERTDEVSFHDVIVTRLADITRDIGKLFPDIPLATTTRDGEKSKQTAVTAAPSMTTRLAEMTAEMNTMSDEIIHLQETVTPDAVAAADDALKQYARAAEETRERLSARNLWFAEEIVPRREHIIAAIGQSSPPVLVYDNQLANTTEQIVAMRQSIQPVLDDVSLVQSIITKFGTDESVRKQIKLLYTKQQNIIEKANIYEEIQRRLTTTNV